MVGSPLGKTWLGPREDSVPKEEGTVPRRKAAESDWDPGPAGPLLDDQPG